MTIRILGVKSLVQKLEKLPVDVTKAVRDEVARGALTLQNEMRRSIQKGPKTGRTYRKGSLKGGRAFKFHRASAPGESPATDSGRLVSHINMFLFRRGLSAKAGVTDMSDVRYSRRLEFGGRDKRGVYIAPRPFVRPALIKHGRKIVTKIEKAAKRVIKNVR